MRSNRLRALLVCAVLISTLTIAPQADTAPQSLPFSQDWTNTSLIAANDNWTGVPGIIGYRGDGMAGTSGATDPQTVVAEGTNVVNVMANLTSASTTGGVAEFHIANPVVALQGSATARAPHIVISVSTLGQSNIQVAYNLRDVDGTSDNTTQPVALQYRVGGTGNFTNLPAGFVADASSGPNLATLVTAVAVTLPPAANNQALVQLRIITTDAASSDEWIGIDDISVTGTGGGGANPSGAMTASPSTVTAFDSITLTVTVTPGTNPASTGIGVTADLSAIGLGNATFHDDGLSGDATAGDNKFSFIGSIPTGVSGGTKSLSATIADAQNRTATTTPATQVTVVAPTDPSGSGSAAPSTVAPGGTTTLTVSVTPGTAPSSTGLAVTGNLSAIGGSASQPFVATGNTFTFGATVSLATTDGLKTLPITITDAENRTGSTALTVTVETPPTNSSSVIVISQVYGGGGNLGPPAATYQNDYVELYNRGSDTVDIGGWSLQYAATAGSGWNSQKLALGGTIEPGHYYLIALASGGANGAALPTPSISGSINISGTNGKLALVDSLDGLDGDCPLADGDQRPHVMDFVGYGTANCQEGATKAPAPSNTTAILRLGSGSIDTDRNGSDFVTGVPAPRSTSPVAGGGGSGPVALAVLSTDPAKNRVNVPRDATIGVIFTQPVDVFEPWFDITCASTGQHNSATFASTGSGQFHYITPNVNFLAGEVCTVTVFTDQVSDTVTHTEHLAANYVWSFTVASGAIPLYPASVHLTMGNPSGAAADVNQPNNYLMEKAEFALSYNRAFGRPNWVSWHLSNDWTGFLSRVDTFRADPAVPPDADWYRVQGFDFSGSGFDRGHMTPNADRNKETSIPINQATFLMSNMVAQAPDNNQGPWASLEGYLRTLLPANEVYIVAGGSGVGGTGSNGGTTTTLAAGHVTVPAQTWKVALVLPKGENDLSRVSCTTRTIAVIMPNTQGIRNTPWDSASFLTTVDAVETLTGYDLFSALPVPFQNCIEARKDGDPALPLMPGNQTIIFAAPANPTFGDAPFTVSATGGASGNPVTFAASGACTSGSLNGATITIVSAGPCTITASQAGSAAYNAAADVTHVLLVNKATATIDVTGFTGAYDGAPHAATGTAKGVNAEALTGLDLGASFTNVPGGTASWSFAGNTNYYGAAGTAAIVIGQATPSFSGLSSPVIEAGTPTVTLGGIVSLGTLAPTGSVTITLNGVSQAVAVGTSGQFSASFVTASLAPSAAPYPVAYAYSGDTNFTSTAATGSVTVTDTTAPSIGSVSASQPLLSPPNHKMIDITIAYQVAEFTGAPVCALSVSSNEAVNGQGDGNTSADWQVLDAHRVQLRSERAGGGNGRIYTITIRCTDPSGNIGSATATVNVPK